MLNPSEMNSEEGEKKKGGGGGGGGEVVGWVETIYEGTSPE